MESVDCPCGWQTNAHKPRERFAIGGSGVGPVQRADVAAKSDDDWKLRQRERGSHHRSDQVNRAP